MLRILSVVCLQLPVLLLSAPSQAAGAVDRNVFAFGGRFTHQFFEYSFMPLSVEYEDNYVLGAGYQQFFLGGPDGPKLGAEAGAAIRSGDDTSSEIWGGLVGRYDGLVVTDAFRVSAGVTVGVSATSGTIGIEAQREIDSQGDTSLLFYLGPEISISPASNPDLELFWRVHHRSGAWETLGGMHDGANANVVGLRYAF